MPETTVTEPQAGIGKWLLIALAVVIVDQITKWVILGSFAEGERLPVIDGFFDLTLWYNPGAAFSFLANAGGWQRWFFTGIGALAAIFIFYLLRQSTDMKVFSFGLSLILGGAIGNNLIDRPIHGKVVDFLLFYWDQYSFPAFNVADSAITVGAVCLLADELFRYLKARKSGAAANSSNPPQ